MILTLEWRNRQGSGPGQFITDEMTRKGLTERRPCKIICRSQTNYTTSIVIQTRVIANARSNYVSRGYQVNP